MAEADELVFAGLGGVGEIGMNLSIYGFGGRRQRAWLAVDLGVSFGDEEHLPGIDTIMPDIRFLEQERENLAGLVLTHAHEDHFGALIDLWPRLKCPVFATKFTAALFEAKCASERNPPKIPITVVPSGGRIELGPFGIEFIPVAHSIPESHALAIHTPAGIVLHTGDWKIDPTPVVGLPTDEGRLRELGDAGVLALIGDSTNAIRDGRSPSETEVAKTIVAVVKAAKGRVAVTTFASNVARSQTPRACRDERWWWSAARWSASFRWRGKPVISTACKIFAAPIFMAIFHRTRCWRCVREVRASRARRWRASPMPTIRRLRSTRATA